MESNPFPFNSETLLAKANGGRTIATYRRNQTVFSQGEPADAVFYIQQGQVKLTVFSAPKGKKLLLGCLESAIFVVRDVWLGSPFALRRPKRSRNPRSCGSRKRR